MPKDKLSLKIPAQIWLIILFSLLVLTSIFLFKQIMISVIALLVLTVSIVMYGKIANYGEAALALVAGLLMALAITWTLSKFIIFIVVWVVFTIFVFLISSIKLAGKLQHIYRHAAVTIDSKNYQNIEKQLTEAGSSTPRGMLGPLERAESIRLLAFRKYPIKLMKSTLTTIETLSVATQVSYKKITLFISDLYMMVAHITGQNEQEISQQFHRLIILVMNIICDTPASPEEFFNTFQQTRWFVISGRLEPIPYLQEIYHAFNKGFSPDDIVKKMNKKYKES